jgi:hypothetical protein
MVELRRLFTEQETTPWARPGVGRAWPGVGRAMPGVGRPGVGRALSRILPALPRRRRAGWLLAARGRAIFGRLVTGSLLRPSLTAMTAPASRHDRSATAWPGVAPVGW